jgi:hypothetical protein
MMVWVVQPMVRIEYYRRDFVPVGGGGGGGGGTIGGGGGIF